MIEKISTSHSHFNRSNRTFQTPSSPTLLISAAHSSQDRFWQVWIPRRTHRRLQSSPVSTPSAHGSGVKESQRPQAASRSRQHTMPFGPLPCCALTLALGNPKQGGRERPNHSRVDVFASFPSPHLCHSASHSVIQPTADHCP